MKQWKFLHIRMENNSIHQVAFLSEGKDSTPAQTEVQALHKHDSVIHASNYGKCINTIPSIILITPLYAAPVHIPLS